MSNPKGLGYRVDWDNGLNAAGTFEEVFDTEEEAEAFGREWLAQFCGISLRLRGLRSPFESAGYIVRSEERTDD